jgi:hypothetical protein
MKTRLVLFILLAHASLVFMACGAARDSLTRAEIDEAVHIAEGQQYNKLEQAQQSVALALSYHDQGGYEKSAALFLQAADLYNQLGTEDDERKALLAAAKVQLKGGQREAFLLTIARYKGLLEPLEMPTEEERFLINLSNQMKGEPLTYPVSTSWRVVFQN